MTHKPRTRHTNGRLRQSDFRLLAEFRFVLRRFMRFSEDAAAKVGLEPQQHQTLLVIKAYEGEGRPSIGHIAEQLGVRHHSAVGLVNRLVEAKLLTRTIDAVDRRRVNLGLTSKADRTLAALSSAHRDELRQMAPMLRATLSRLESP
jgi:DNA-binding MarR family transcriptional regulator